MKAKGHDFISSLQRKRFHFTNYCFSEVPRGLLSMCTSSMSGHNISLKSKKTQATIFYAIPLDNIEFLGGDQNNICLLTTLTQQHNELPATITNKALAHRASTTQTTSSLNPNKI
ncbi:hypothetical protein Droror1_Dr00022859 [Drosera rotundifolia]